VRPAREAIVDGAEGADAGKAAEGAADALPPARPGPVRAPRAPRLVGAERLRPTGLPQGLVLGSALAGAALDLAAARLGGLEGLPARERAVRRIAGALGRLKGPYAKLGQFASIRHDVLPGPATEALRALRDRVPPLPFERVRLVVESELGAALDVAFAAFDREPLGAASIAQAHRARLPSGEEVVVKVQYPWLEGSLPVDLRLVRGLVGLAARGGRGGRDPRALYDEFAAGLREELDFRREARVGREIAANLAGDDAIVVPEIVDSHSTRRVLTVHHHPAVRITDREALARLGVAPRAVLEVLARAYASQVFVDGLFHADPHPGNLFVVDEPGAAERPRLLFVDFGLSRRLDPALRAELRRGIHALLQRDLEGFLDGMERLGTIAPGRREAVGKAVAAMFERIRDRGGALAVGGGQVLSLKDEAVALLRETEGLQLPNDLLLYARTLATVFALGRELDPDVDMMKLTLPSLLRFLAARDPD